jgi:hypothetical protein
MEPDQDLFAILGHAEDETKPPPLGTQLRAFLVERYGDAATRGKPKPADANQPIRIDDRKPRDRYSRYCDVFVRVPDNRDGLFLLELHHPPYNAEVEMLIKAKDGRIWQGAAGPSSAPVLCRIPVRPKDVSPFLRKLARAVRGVTAKGQSYPNPNWKWLADRTADSLERFAQHVDEFRRSAR